MVANGNKRFEFKYQLVCLERYRGIIAGECFVSSPRNKLIAMLMSLESFRVVLKATVSQFFKISSEEAYDLYFRFTLIRSFLTLSGMLEIEFIKKI